MTEISEKECPVKLPLKKQRYQKAIESLLKVMEFRPSVNCSHCGHNKKIRDQAIAELEKQPDLEKENETLEKRILLLRTNRNEFFDENKRLKDYFRRSFIARCPDGECSKNCKECPKVDEWIAQALRSRK